MTAIVLSQLKLFRQSVVALLIGAGSALWGCHTPQEKVAPQLSDDSHTGVQFVHEAGSGQRMTVMFSEPPPPIDHRTVTPDSIREMSDRQLLRVESMLYGLLFRANGAGNVAESEAISEKIHLVIRARLALMDSQPDPNWFLNIPMQPQR